MRHLRNIVICASLGLTSLGCEQSPLQEEADQVRRSSQSDADRVRDSSQQKADEVRKQSDRQEKNDERHADEIENQGERSADAIEEKGERTADQIEAADSYWREHYTTRPYIKGNTPYESYRNAYLFGYKARSRYPGKTFDEVISNLERDWNNQRSSNQLTWEEAKAAARDAWDAEYPKVN